MANVPSVSERADVVVVGGGPAGSAAAAFLARHGRSVVLLERDQFPRHHVGESTLQGVFGMLDDELGVGPRLRELGFRVKTGASFVWGKHREPWSFHFTEAETARAEDSDFLHRVGFQIDRAVFDHALLTHAKEVGAEVWREHALTRVEQHEANEKPLEVTYKNEKGETGQIWAEYLIDCSGLSSTVSRQYGVHRVYDSVRNFAVYSYWSPSVLDFAELGGDITDRDASNILIVHGGSYWVWLIPLKEKISVGVVSSMEHASEMASLGVEAFYRDRLYATPEVQSLFSRANARHTGDPVRVVKDWSHVSDRLSLDRVFFAGDAAAFVDPILSSGVHLALTFGISSARSVNTLLTHPGATEWVHDWYNAVYREAYEDFRRMADAWYLGASSSSAWFAVASQRVRERLGVELTAARAFREIASGSLTAGSHGDWVCSVDTSKLPLTAFFAPLSNRFSYSIAARAEIASHLLGFPEEMARSAHAQDSMRPLDVQVDEAVRTLQASDTLGLGENARLGIVSRRGSPVLECLAYEATDGERLPDNAYYPIAPVLLDAIRRAVPAGLTIAELSRSTGEGESAWQAYLQPLVDVGWLRLAGER